MPRIYLSPSTQEANLYVNGGTEEEIMNQLADAMVPYLNANGISFTRNTPQMTAASSIRQSNEGNYDLHLALHSNAAPESTAGTVRGTDVYYYPSSTRGKQIADLLVDAFKTIYPDPSKVRALSTTRLGEISRTRAPVILIETAYHDNPEDAQWIKDNIGNMARVIVEALTKYFGLPFITPSAPYQGVVNIRWGHLNLRDRPSTTDSQVIGALSDGQQITILGRHGDWYSVETPAGIGFVSADYVQSY